jgi:predicted nucleic acid-binding protein
MILRVDDMLLSRAEEFETLGVMGMDAVHIACSEKAGTILLSTDDDLIKGYEEEYTRYIYTCR